MPCPMLRCCAEFSVRVSVRECVRACVCVCVCACVCVCVCVHNVVHKPAKLCASSISHRRSEKKRPGVVFDRIASPAVVVAARRHLNPVVMSSSNSMRPDSEAGLGLRSAC